MSKSFMRNGFFAALLLLLSFGLANAQEFRGTITGTIKDPQCTGRKDYILGWGISFAIAKHNCLLFFKSQQMFRHYLLCFESQAKFPTGVGNLNA